MTGAVTKPTRKACEGASTIPRRTTEHMEECRVCGTQVRHDMVNHPFWGFSPRNCVLSTEEEGIR